MQLPANWAAQRQNAAYSEPSHHAAARDGIAPERWLCSHASHIACRGSQARAPRVGTRSSLGVAAEVVLRNTVVGAVLGKDRLCHL